MNMAINDSAKDRMLLWHYECVNAERIKQIFQDLVKFPQFVAIQMDMN